MKSTFSFILGVVITFFVCYFAFNQPDKKQITPIVKWETKLVKSPAKIDTVIRIIVKHDTILKKIIVKDTIQLVKIDTVYKKQEKYYKTTFEFTPPEFDLFAEMHGKAPVDSVNFRYQMNRQYISYLMQKSRNTSKIKPWMYFVGGAVFTGTIFYFVK